MNRFYPSKCLTYKDAVGNKAGSDSLLLPLIMEKNSNYVLFFPIEDEVAEIINFIVDNEYDIYGDDTTGELNVIEMVRTMKYSWDSLGNFISGIFMKEAYSEEVSDYTLDSNIILSSEDGYVESIVKVGFVLSAIFSLVDNIPIMIGDALLDRLNSYSEEVDRGIEKDIREQDKKIDSEAFIAAKKIMGDKKNK